jgi:hypothetical protein
MPEETGCPARHRRPRGPSRASCLPWCGAGGVEVGEADELAVEDLAEVVEVVDAAGGGVALVAEVVEVGGRPSLVGVVEVRVVLASVRRVALTRHVVDHRVDVHLHAGLAARAHHGLELRLVAHPAGELVVHRLVDLPPRVQDRVASVTEVLALDRVGRRRHLHAAVSLGTEHRRALVRDRRPVPLEQVRHHFALHAVVAAGRVRSSRGRDGGGGHAQQKHCGGEARGVPAGTVQATRT